MGLGLKSLVKLVIQNHKIQVRESECEAWWIIPSLTELSPALCCGPMVSSHIVKSEVRRREDSSKATTLQTLVLKFKAKLHRQNITFAMDKNIWFMRGIVNVHFHMGDNSLEWLLHPRPSIPRPGTQGYAAWSWSWVWWDSRKLHVSKNATFSSFPIW